MKKQIYSFLLLLFTSVTNSQVLYTENFDNLALGEVSQDPTGGVPGKGGWYVIKGTIPYTFPVEIVPETGRGNVLAIGTNVNSVNGLGNSARVTQKNIDKMWNNRSAGNDVLKLEYDVYFEKTVERRDLSVILSKSYNGYIFINRINNSEGMQGSLTKGYLNLQYEDKNNFLSLFLGANNKPEYNNFPYNSWLSVQLYVAYKYENGVQLGGTVYVYIPALNILKKADFTHDIIVDMLSLFGGGGGDSSAAVKYDNIKLTALKNVPLSINEVLATKFNVYPNPATNVVNINSAENKPVSKVAVYDVAGKLLSTQSFNNETNVQLHTESLASGTYMLHIETTEGTAVKKLVKK